MPEHESDIEAILARRHDNGADYWATPDGRCYVGNPFSTLACLAMLHELGVPKDHEAVAGGLEIVLGACRDDGRIRLAPRAPLYPCYTAEAARVMCRFGMTGHAPLQRTMDYFMGAAHDTGGWRCNFTRFGRGPETVCANPGATLNVLDVVRHVPAYRRGNDVIEQAVGSLLDHWESRLPAGPCHWGIGSRFLKVEYPFLRYNLFFYVYVLSFFERAREDARFGSAVATLEARLDGQGRVVVERPHRDLKGLGFCARGQPSELATRRYHEICRNLAGAEAAPRIQ